MPKSGRRGQSCPGQLLLLMPFARNSRGRFVRLVTGMPCQYMAVRRDLRGRFACLAGAH